MAVTASKLCFLHRSTEFQVVAVGIGKVNRLRRYPLVVHWSVDNNASLPQGRGGGFDIDFLNSESEVFLRPSSPVFLEHHHAGVTRPQEQPLAAFVPETDFKA